MTYQDSHVFFCPSVITSRATPNIGAALMGWVAEKFRSTHRGGKVKIRTTGPVDRRTLHDIGLSTHQFKFGVTQRNFFE